MATDALDPSHPTGANQVELSSELRGIKTRLVSDKAAIETLQTQIVPVTSAGAKGLVLLATANSNDVFTAIDATEVGQGLVQDYPDLPSLKAYLGIVGATNETVTTTTNKGTIEWAGGLKMKWTIDTIPSGGGSTGVSWDSPFESVALFGGTNMHGGGEAGWMDGVPTLTGANVDHNNGSSKITVTWAFGF